MIFRVAANEKNFTVIPNAVLRNKDLSAEALGLLCYLLSHKPEWTTTGKHLSHHFKVGSQKMTRLTKELEQAGYLRRRWYPDPNNSKYTRPDWDVTDIAHCFPDGSLRDSEKRDPVERDPVNHDPSLRSTNSKEVLSKKEELIRNPPAGVSQSAWEKWWHYKSPSNRAPGKAHITRTTNDFARLVKAGVTDFDKLVDYTIDKGWQGIGDETYSYTKSLIHQDKDMLLLRGIQ